MCQTTLVASS
uniref:Uncharacterized protein n=1 Tax=Arundo donax TaxID=35708 RepID=A0A0A9C2Z9_ARUDO